MPAQTTSERFADKVNTAGPLPLVRGVHGRCHVWTAATNEKGYGKFWNGARMVRAHRWSYEQHVGPVPDGLEVDHRCNNRACVRPSHLAALTHAANVARSNGPTAINARKTHCPAGHAYDAANTHHKPDGSRRCRTCDREQARARKDAARLAPQPAAVARLTPRTTPEKIRSAA